jgi:hypothetical protein
VIVLGYCAESGAGRRVGFAVRQFAVRVFRLPGRIGGDDRSGPEER